MLCQPKLFEGQTRSILRNKIQILALYNSSKGANHSNLIVFANRSEQRVLISTSLCLASTSWSTGIPNSEKRKKILQYLPFMYTGKVDNYSYCRFCFDICISRICNALLIQCASSVKCDGMGLSLQFTSRPRPQPCED